MNIRLYEKKNQVIF